MSKRVFIIHGWDGYPEEGWFPWLKSELESRGFEVFVPQLPKPEEPRIKAWVSKLVEVAGTADRNTYFVGHSMGCQTIIRYLETLPDDVEIGGAVFVAGFLGPLTNLEDDEVVKDVAREWLETPVNFTKAKSDLPKSVAIFSDNDPYVSLGNKEEFTNKLGSRIIIEHNQGHFSGSTGITELPVALNAILEITGYE